jgi:hypothetical protein
MAKQFNYRDAWRQLVARAWTDPAFKAKLLADPAAVLKANGLSIPPGITVKVVENTDKVVHLVLPIRSAPQELSDAELSEVELQQAAGGTDYNTFWTEVQQGNRPAP